MSTFFCFLDPSPPPICMGSIFVRLHQTQSAQRNMYYTKHNVIGIYFQDRGCERGYYIFIEEFVSQLYCNNTLFTYMIPLSSNSGSVCQYYENCNFPQFAKLPKHPIYTLSVALYDQDRNLINLNGSDWEMLIEFE